MFEDRRGLIDTSVELDLRRAERTPCPPCTRLAVLVRPGFEAFPARVRDLTVRGIGLLCDRPLAAGSRLALSWEWGPPERWRTLLAHVVHATPHPRGGWIIGCEFDKPLNEAELIDFLEQAAWAAGLAP